MKENIRKTFLQLKDRYPDAILLIRDSNGYQAWDEDAVHLCKVIDSIKLTIKKGTQTCWISLHQMDSVLNKMVKEGYKIAICDPLEKPS